MFATCLTLALLHLDKLKDENGSIDSKTFINEVKFCIEICRAAEKRKWLLMDEAKPGYDGQPCFIYDRIDNEVRVDYWDNIGSWQNTPDDRVDLWRPVDWPDNPFNSTSDSVAST